MRLPRAISIGIPLAAVLSALILISLPSGPAQSRESDRTLKLYFAHTGERGEFTYKKNGRYDRGELARINQFLRDWRRNEPARMDPLLLDLVWSIYRESGSRDYIHVVSAYRSPATNEALRKRSSGVAKNSQHRLGKAMDWFVTDVPLAKLRAVAMKMQGGGVGYYPKSGSPFIHTDTGSVRAWPRMSREQLVAIFPKGNTLHLPADGKPLPGYAEAVARRKAAGTTALAYLESDEAAGRGGTDGSGNWLARVFSGKGQKNAAPPADAVAVAEAEDEMSEDAAPAAFAALPTPPDGAAEIADARLPRARPDGWDAAFPGETGTVVASVDAEALTSFVLPARSYDFRPDDIGIRPAAIPLAVPAEDAIASLVGAGGAHAAPPRPEPSMQLAYAAEATVSSIAEADRAILAAFSSIDGSAALRHPDTALMDAATRRAGNDSGGVVLVAADLRAYAEDEDEILDLLDQTTAPDPAVAKLEMPKPDEAADLYRAPDSASEVASLNSRAGPPVDRFARTAAVSDSDRGFFSKLLASLIE